MPTVKACQLFLEKSSITNISQGSQRLCDYTATLYLSWTSFRIQNFSVLADGILQVSRGVIRTLSSISDEDFSPKILNKFRQIYLKICTLYTLKKFNINLELFSSGFLRSHCL